MLLSSFILKVDKPYRHHVVAVLFFIGIEVVITLASAQESRSMPTYDLNNSRTSHKKDETPNFTKTIYRITTNSSLLLDSLADLYTSGRLTFWGAPSFPVTDIQISSPLEEQLLIETITNVTNLNININYNFNWNGFNLLSLGTQDNNDNNNNNNNDGPNASNNNNNNNNDRNNNSNNNNKNSPKVGASKATKELVDATEYSYYSIDILVPNLLEKRFNDSAMSPPIPPN